MQLLKLALGATALLSVLLIDHGVCRAEEVVASPDTLAPPKDAESFQFEAEVHRMMDIVINSLYTNKEVFLRELISNASDALDKIRFLSLTKPELLADKAELEVRIEYDKEAKTLTIRDSGIGMKHDDLVQNLGTVARSGTTKFMEALDEGMADMNMIGQFGVGFYSAFLVADRVTVASKHPDDPKQHVWESLNGKSEFHVYEDPRGNTLGRGTEITLHLKEDCTEYADANRLKELTKHYSEFVTHPIHLRTTSTVTVDVDDDEDDMDDEATEEKDEFEISDEEEAEKDDKPEKEKKTEEVVTQTWDVVNDNPAIWTRDKDGITDEEYQAFWQVVSKETYSNATRWTHFNAEGNINFKSILYLPEQPPQSFRFGAMGPPKGGLKLYVRKVLISDEFDLMPSYLSFIRGVVDSEDLPLNVNRETLQESKIVQVIKKKLVRKAIEMIRDLSKDEAPVEETKDEDEDEDEDGKEPEKKDTPYIAWYKQFGPAIKIGIMEDEPNRGKLTKLLRFQSSKSDGEWIGFEDYVSRMKDWQQEIYVIAGVSKEQVEKSQFMERFQEKDVEVLYLTDPVDEYMFQQVRDFDGKKFVSITSESVKFKDEDEDLAKRREKAYNKKFKPLTKWLKKLYGNSVMRVSISKRLGTSPAIISNSEYGHSANMERIMQAQAYQSGTQNEFMMRAMKVFEINPRHPLVLKLLEGCPPEKEEEGDEPFVVSPELENAAWILYDMASLNGGFPITDTVAHTKRMTSILQSQMDLSSLELEDEIDPPVEEEEAPDVDPDSIDLDGINMEDFGEHFEL